MSGDNRGCIDRNECLDFPCLNGGTCYNKEPRLRYSCACPVDYYGDNCEFVREQQHLKLSTSALASVVACLVVIISKYFFLLSSKMLLKDAVALIHRYYCSSFVYILCVFTPTSITIDKKTAHQR